MDTHPPLRVLVVEDDERLSAILCEELEDRGHAATRARTVAQGLEEIGLKEFDVTVLDLSLPDGNGLDVLRAIRDQQLETEVVVVTGHGDIPTAVEAMRAGAYDFLAKPTGLNQLTAVVAKAAEKGRLRRENRALRARLQGYETDSLPFDPRLVSPGVAALVAKASAWDLPVVIEGPSGSGREYLARMIHAGSSRAAHPFLVLDCSNAEAEDLEQEIFGRETEGGEEARPGLLEVADGGSLLVRAIERLPQALADRLLRATEAKVVFRVGSRRAMRANVRPMAATSLDLAFEVKRGRLASELHQRWGGLTIKVPALRERGEAIVPLANALAKQLSPGLSVSADARSALLAYWWPGNLRELKAVIQRAAILARGDRIGADMIRAALGPVPGIGASESSVSGPWRKLGEAERKLDSEPSDPDDPSSGGT